LGAFPCLAVPACCGLGAFPCHLPDCWGLPPLYLPEVPPQEFFVCCGQKWNSKHLPTSPRTTLDLSVEIVGWSTFSEG
jgi:hypothetical protein